MFRPLNETRLLFRVPVQSFRVDRAGNQMCSEFWGIFDFRRGFFVQSFGGYGSEFGDGEANPPGLRPVLKSPHFTMGTGADVPASCPPPTQRPSASRRDSTLSSSGRILAGRSPRKTPTPDARRRLGCLAFGAGVRGSRSRLHQRLDAVGIQAFTGGKSFGSKATVNGWFNPQHKLATEFA